MSDTLHDEFEAEAKIIRGLDAEGFRFMFRKDGGGNYRTSETRLAFAFYQAGRAAAEADTKDAERYLKIKARSFFGNDNKFYFEPIPHHWHIRAHQELDDAVDAIDAAPPAQESGALSNVAMPEQMPSEIERILQNPRDDSAETLYADIRAFLAAQGPKE